MKLLLLLSLLVSTAACTRINQGEFGIVSSSFTGDISDQPATPGFNGTLFHSIETIDATEVRVEMKGLTPKDRDGVLVTAAVTATYRINPERAIGFYKQTHEIDRVQDNPNKVLGYKVMQDTIINATTKAFSSFAVAEIVPRKYEIEAEIKKVLQEKIDERYADAFKIVNVNLNETRLGDAVETVLQSQAIAKSQKQLLELQKQLAEQETALLQKKFDGMKQIAGSTGIGVKDVMNFKLREQYNTVLSEMAKSHTPVQVQTKSEPE